MYLLNMVLFVGEEIPSGASQESVLLAEKQWVAKISFLVLNRVSNRLNKPLQPCFISTFTSLKVCISTKFILAPDLFCYSVIPMYIYSDYLTEH